MQKGYFVSLFNYDGKLGLYEKQIATTGMRAYGVQLCRPYGQFMAGEGIHVMNQLAPRYERPYSNVLANIHHPTAMELKPSVCIREC